MIKFAAIYLAFVTYSVLGAVTYTFPQTGTGSGNATNAVTTISSNGVQVATGVTALNFKDGSGDTVGLVDAGSGVVDITINSQSGGSSGTATNLYGNSYPVDITKATFVFIGDSITATVTGYPNILRTNYNLLSAAGFTNQAVSGDTFNGQTNIFWSNTLATLPVIPDGSASNVIISCLFGANENLGNTNVQGLINARDGFFAALLSRNYKIINLTTLMRGSWCNSSVGAETNWAKLNDSTLRNTNINITPIDIIDPLPDPNDISFFVDAATLALHPNKAGHEIIAKAWINGFSFGTKRRSITGEAIRCGTNVVMFDKNFQKFFSVDDGGRQYSVRAMGPGLHGDPTGSANIAGIFAAGSGTQPALIARAADDATTGITFDVETSAFTRRFTVYNDGYIEFSGGNGSIIDARSIWLHGAGLGPQLAIGTGGSSPVSGALSEVVGLSVVSSLRATNIIYPSGITENSPSSNVAITNTWGWNFCSGSIGVATVQADFSTTSHLVYTNSVGTNQTIQLTNICRNFGGMFVETIGTNFSVYFSAPAGVIIQWPSGLTNSLITNSSFNVFPVATNLIRITTQNFL